eukprot:g2993.t1 g2993   contig12:1220849-1222873(-)
MSLSALSALATIATLTAEVESVLPNPTAVVVASKSDNKRKSKQSSETTNKSPTGKGRATRRTSKKSPVKEKSASKQSTKESKVAVSKSKAKHAYASASQTPQVCAPSSSRRPAKKRFVPAEFDNAAIDGALLSDAYGIQIADCDIENFNKTACAMSNITSNNNTATSSKQPKKRRHKSDSTPTFPTTLMAILCTPKNHEYIAFLSDDVRFIIVHPGGLEGEVLPLYFDGVVVDGGGGSGMTFDHFVETMIAWGFQVGNDTKYPQINIYSHPLFRRGDWEMCLRIEKPGSTTTTGDVGGSEEGNVKKEGELQQSKKKSSPSPRKKKNKTTSAGAAVAHQPLVGSIPSSNKAVNIGEERSRSVTPASSPKSGDGLPLFSRRASEMMMLANQNSNGLGVVGALGGVNNLNGMDNGNSIIGLNEIGNDPHIRRILEARIENKILGHYSNPMTVAMLRRTSLGFAPGWNGPANSAGGMKGENAMGLGSSAISMMHSDRGLGMMGLQQRQSVDPSGNQANDIVAKALAVLQQDGQAMSLGSVGSNTIPSAADNAFVMSRRHTMDHMPTKRSSLLLAKNMAMDTSNITTNLDAMTERFLERSMARRMQSRTSLVGGHMQLCALFGTGNGVVMRGGGGGMGGPFADSHIMQSVGADGNAQAMAMLALRRRDFMSSTSNSSGR